MYEHTIIAGNLGRDPEMRYTPSGQAVCNLNVATNRSYTDANGQLVKRTKWFRVSVWGKQAEACNTYLHKGSKVLVEGHLTEDPETGGPHVFQKQDGTYASSFELNASTVRFLSSKGENGDADEPAPAGAPIEGDNIPF
jgi:single-strand DNA-binding protein